MKRTFTFELTTDEIAEAFSGLASDRQVDVLVAIARQFASWEPYPHDMQNAFIAAQLQQAGGIAEAMIKAWATPSNTDPGGEK